MMKPDEHEKAPSSPCIRNCCLDENDVCLGCFRNIDEITSWSSLSIQEKLNTLQTCEQRKLEIQNKAYKN
jgi:predicted Fe-S protein YdhL (DUF1289 family)